MNFKTYTLETKIGTLTYGYVRKYRKWAFTFTQPENFSLLYPCKGGEQGHKVANIIAGSIKRCGKVDGLARANIAKLFR